MTTREKTADHAERSPSTTPAMESEMSPRVSIDHAELARLAAKLRETKYRWTMGYRDDVLLNPDGPKAADALETLLSEIAALRDYGRDAAKEALEYRRQRDELRKALERIATVDMGGGFLGALACRQVASEALANQGADQ